MVTKDQYNLTPFSLVSSIPSLSLSHSRLSFALSQLSYLASLHPAGARLLRRSCFIPHILALYRKSCSNLLRALSRPRLSPLVVAYLSIACTMLQTTLLSIPEPTTRLFAHGHPKLGAISDLLAITQTRDSTQTGYSFNSYYPVLSFFLFNIKFLFLGFMVPSLHSLLPCCGLCH